MSERIRMAHGAGGRMMQQLIREVIYARLQPGEEVVLDDAAELPGAERLAFTTDSFTVKPLFFPGGDIGSLAVSGTVNDLLMKGARPRHLSLGMIIEEGLPLADFERILTSIAEACREAGATIETGDTKVVAKGEADGIYINTSGVGPIFPGVMISGTRAKPGDAVLVSGDIGRHGLAVMAERHGLELAEGICSDAAPLTAAVLPLLECHPASLHVLRDPTRGGVATTLCEIASASGVRIELAEAEIPVSPAVVALAELLGLDPLYLPCEGRFLAIVEPDEADAILRLLRSEGGCPGAARIGEVHAADRGEVLKRTVAGGRQILEMPAGDLLPRIC